MTGDGQPTLARGGSSHNGDYTLPLFDAMPQARRLIDDSAYDADTVAMMGDAFDTAWDMIEAAFKGQPQATIDDARTLLASTIIHQVKLGLSHSDILQEEAIRVMRERFPTLRIRGGGGVGTLMSV